jgi:Putative beta-barrel porin-2, OmpL-like. bbp2
MGHEMVSSPPRLITRSLTGFGPKRMIAGVIAAVAAGTIPVANAGGIELGKGLSITGFLDQSYQYVDADGAPKYHKFGIDQFETDFLYSASDSVSAEVDIEYGDSTPNGPAGGNETFVEQGFVKKSFTDQFSVKLGRFLSYTGWEAEEPTGLFQYSGTGYAPYFYGWYQQGISAYYSGGMFDLMASVVNNAFDPNDYNSKDHGYEVGAALMPVEGLTWKAFYTINKLQGTSGKDKILNTWISYAMSGFTFAGEYNNAKYAGGGDGDGYLLMANYATGPWGITLRYHDFKIKDAAGATTVKNNAVTLSPSYKIGDSLLLVSEVRRDDFGVGNKATSFALEALFTF